MNYRGIFMENRILFISERTSMVSTALMKGLETKGFEFTEVRTNVTEISRVEFPPSIWLLYLMSIENKHVDVLSYLKDQVQEHGYRLYVIGTPEELREVMTGFPAECLRGIFERPFHAEDIADRLLAEADELQQESEGKRILLVDDDEIMLNTMKDLLSKYYRVYTANSGMNALQLLVTTDVDLILLDYEMPVISGPKILEMLRSETHTKDIPVMFLTSRNDKESIVRVMSLNPVNYLLKSLPQSEILLKIKEFFGK